MGKTSTNPKDKIGRTKPPMHLIPGPALVQEAAVLNHGAEKYGPYNWREHSVAATVYVSAALRHIHAWFDRQSFDPESGLSHIAHIRACMGILLDAEASGKLVDDRPLPGETARELERQTIHAVPPTENAQTFDAGPDVGYTSGMPNEIPQEALDFLPQSTVQQSEDFTREPETDDEVRLIGVDDGGRDGTATPGHIAYYPERENMMRQLRRMGCDRTVAACIAEGTTLTPLRHAGAECPIFYIAGPMRGHKHFNFPQFDEARKQLNYELQYEKGIYHDVISPADIDRAASEVLIGQELVDCVYRDTMALIWMARYPARCGVIFLPGWARSVGARAEYALARWLNIDCFVFDSDLMAYSRMKGDNL